MPAPFPVATTVANEGALSALGEDHKANGRLMLMLLAQEDTDPIAGMVTRRRKESLHLEAFAPRSWLVAGGGRRAHDYPRARGPEPADTNRAQNQEDPPMSTITFVTDGRRRSRAARRGVTLSDLTREAIEAHLGSKRGKRTLLAAGAGRSGSGDVSARIEEILRIEVSR